MKVSLLLFQDFDHAWNTFLDLVLRWNTHQRFGRCFKICAKITSATTYNHSTIIYFNTTIRWWLPSIWTLTIMTTSPFPCRRTIVSFIILILSIWIITIILVDLKTTNISNFSCFWIFMITYIALFVLRIIGITFIVRITVFDVWDELVWECCIE